MLVVGTLAVRVVGTSTAGPLDRALAALAVDAFADLAAAEPGPDADATRRLPALR